MYDLRTLSNGVLCRGLSTSFENQTGCDCVSRAVLYFQALLSNRIRVELERNEHIFQTSWIIYCDSSALKQSSAVKQQVKRDFARNGLETNLQYDREDTSSNSSISQEEEQQAERSCWQVGEQTWERSQRHLAKPCRASNFWHLVYYGTESQTHRVFES